MIIWLWKFWPTILEFKLTQLDSNWKATHKLWSRETMIISCQGDVEVVVMRCWTCRKVFSSPQCSYKWKCPQRWGKSADVTVEIYLRPNNLLLSWFCVIYTKIYINILGETSVDPLITVIYILQNTGSMPQLELGISRAEVNFLQSPNSW